jgi:hypothetical protein
MSAWAVSTEKCSSLESIQNSLGTGLLIIHSSPLLRFVRILDQNIKSILHLFDRCQLLGSSLVGRLESLILRSVSSLVLGCQGVLIVSSAWNGDVRTDHSFLQVGKSIDILLMSVFCKLDLVGFGEVGGSKIGSLLIYSSAGIKT